MIWGITLHPGEEWTREIHCNEHLTLAALECRPGKNNGELNPASCLLLKIDNNDHVICTLEKGSTPQQNLDLVLQQRETVTFTVEGTGVVYLTGYSSAADNVNTCEGASILHDQTVPLVQEVGVESVIDYSNELEAKSHSINIPSEEADLDEVTNIKQEVEGSPEIEESQSGRVYDTEDLSASHQKLDSPPYDTEIHLQKGKKGSKDASAYHRAMTRPATHGAIMSNNLSVRGPNAEEEPEGSVRGPNAEEGLATEEWSFQGHEERDYEALIDHTSGEADQNYHRRKKISCISDQPIESSPASISFKSRSLKRNEKTLSQHLKDGKYNRLFSYCRNFQFHQGTLESHPTYIQQFKCQYCGKPFVRKACVRVHERIHTGEKPFKCRYCSKTFNQKAHVQSHEIVHTGDKNFKCQYCDKAFAHLSTARRHERIHTRDQLL